MEIFVKDIGQASLAGQNKNTTKKENILFVLANFCCFPQSKVSLLLFKKLFEFGQVDSLFCAIEMKFRSCVKVKT